MISRRDLAYAHIPAAAVGAERRRAVSHKISSMPWAGPFVVMTLRSVVSRARAVDGSPATPGLSAGKNHSERARGSPGTPVPTG
jgi:hypothetical protein